jgi:hypothetical protein
MLTAEWESRLVAVGPTAQACSTPSTDSATSMDSLDGSPATVFLLCVTRPLPRSAFCYHPQVPYMPRASDLAWCFGPDQR